MDEKARAYIAIDLKSYYASVECVERGLDPLTTNLVVADETRTDKTICLAVSPSLKAYGIPGRARLFEVLQQVDRINAQRRLAAPGHKFTGGSTDADELRDHPEYKLEFITAMPRMAFYIRYSTRVYNVYLNYIAPEDIHVYSIDEVFMDATSYLGIYKMTPRQLAMKMIRDVLEQTGVTATAGIGTNLYLAKIAMDIVAKHMPADEYGVRIAELDEMSYRRLLWDHRPLKDFWRIGRGYSRKLEKNGMFTMGDIARCSLGGPNDFLNEELLYKLFGVNAELLIDHAWGWEPCTIADIKAYRPKNNSLGSGQVLPKPYDRDHARLVAREMTDMLVLDLVDKRLVTDQAVLILGYDRENLSTPEKRRAYQGKVHIDRLGRMVPAHAHGSVSFKKHSSSSRMIIDAVMDLFDQICDPHMTIRRIGVTLNHVVGEDQVPGKESFRQLSLFEDIGQEEEKHRQEEEAAGRERNMQEAILSIRKKYGKNALLKGMNMEEGATARQRNEQIGGHRA